MSNSTEIKSQSKTSRVQVSNLPQDDKELKNQEAADVKGGGGLSGGVINTHIGEEIPQRNRS